MEAVLIEKPFHGVEIKLRLWTGEVVHVDRAFLPLSGPLNVGDRLDIEFKQFKWVTAVGEVTASSRRGAKAMYGHQSVCTCWVNRY